MAGYIAGPEYATEEQFFAAHLSSVDRCAAYFQFAAKRVGPSDSVLSVASGRCAVELKLAQQTGCRILCSDQIEPQCMTATKQLFPQLEFRCIDLLRDGAPCVCDVVLAFGLIWAFNDEELRQFFNFVAASLKPGGRLLLDLGGATDSVAASLYHDYFLRAEAFAIAGLLTVKHGRRFSSAAEPHGYRRTLSDVQAIAAGFEVSDYCEMDRKTEPLRSLTLRRLPAVSRVLGRALPYARLAVLTRKY